MISGCSWSRAAKLSWCILDIRISSGDSRPLPHLLRRCLQPIPGSIPSICAIATKWWWIPSRRRPLQALEDRFPARRRRSLSAPRLAAVRRPHLPESDRMALKDSYIAALDLGSAKTCALVCEPVENGRLRMAGFGVAESRGWRRGTIVNLDSALLSIRKAVETAEDAAGVPIDNAYLGGGGPPNQGVKSRGGAHLGEAAPRGTRSDARGRAQGLSGSAGGKLAARPEGDLCRKAGISARLAKRHPESGGHGWLSAGNQCSSCDGFRRRPRERSGGGQPRGYCGE